MATGQALSISLASVAVTAQIQIGWGGLSWGTGEWGESSKPRCISYRIIINTYNRY